MRWPISQVTSWEIISKKARTHKRSLKGFHLKKNTEAEENHEPTSGNSDTCQILASEFFIFPKLIKMIHHYILTVFK